MKIMIGLPAWKRPNVLRVHTYYMTKYIIPELNKRGFQVEYLVVGSSKIERDVIEKFNNVEFYEMPNILSNKNNHIYNQAKIRNVDFLLWLGSDDFMPLNLILTCIKVAHENGYWASIKNMYMYDSFTKTIKHFVGYLPEHGLVTHGLGAGRIYTKQALQALPRDVFGYNKMSGMDGCLKLELDKFKVPVENRLIESELNSTMFSFKTQQNIWSVNDYSPQILHTVDFDFNSSNFNWLDDSVKVMFDIINPKNCIL
jgi:hypothetical protein